MCFCFPSTVFPMITTHTARCFRDARFAPRAAATAASTTLLMSHRAPSHQSHPIAFGRSYHILQTRASYLAQTTRCSKERTKHHSGISFFSATFASRLQASARPATHHKRKTGLARVRETMLPAFVPGVGPSLGVLAAPALSLLPGLLLPAGGLGAARIGGCRSSHDVKRSLSSLTARSSPR